MNRLLLSTSLAALLGTSAAQADPTFMIGGTFSFGGGAPGQFGLSARILSNNVEGEHTLGAGVTYYLDSGDLGYDVMLGWLHENSVFGLGYDFGQRTPLLTLGLTRTTDGAGDAPPSCQPVVPPPPSCLPPQVPPPPPPP